VEQNNPERTTIRIKRRLQDTAPSAAITIFVCRTVFCWAATSAASTFSSVSRRDPRTRCLGDHISLMKLPTRPDPWETRHRQMGGTRTKVLVRLGCYLWLFVEFLL
jgi:hypothetical protein